MLICIHAEEKYNAVLAPVVLSKVSQVNTYLAGWEQTLQNGSTNQGTAVCMIFASKTEGTRPYDIY